MKKTEYHCIKCKTIMTFQIRNVGKLPHVIGCKTKGCDSKSIEIKPSNDSNTEPIDGIFFRPETKDEWAGIEHQLKHEIMMKHPNKKISRVNKMLKDVMYNIKNHVSSGGLIQLPIAYFSKTQKDVD